MILNTNTSWELAHTGVLVQHMGEVYLCSSHMVAQALVPINYLNTLH